MYHTPSGSLPSDAASEKMREIDIENLTMEQYVALECGDTRRRIRKHEIEGNIDFEIKGQFCKRTERQHFLGE
nr:hypothetical protein [Tanacetum cinerariifolium]